VATEESFLRAIADAPHDDGVRLIFADWLEEHDQPERSEFIRAQIEVSKFPPNDARRPALERRARELLEAHRDAWLRHVPKWACNRCEFRRGFVAFVRAGVRNFRNRADELFQLTPVEEMWFSLWSDEMSDLLACPQLARLTALDLRSNSLSPRCAELLAKCPRLNRLTSLCLDHNYIGANGATALAKSAHLANLTSLDLTSNQIGLPGVSALSSSPHLSRLTTLRLGGDKLGDAGVRVLAWSSLLCHISWLDLSANGITDGGAITIANSPMFGKLISLDLAENSIGKRGARALRQRFGKAVKL
jgi:uncharacterized protein (TIGR02996 family)